MPRNAVLSRMETICAEVMEMPEIFLSEEDEDDSESAVDIDEDAEQDDELAEDDAESVEDCDEEKSGEAASKSDGKGGKPSKEKGVSVKVNCEDKKQQKVGKWISRALRAAVNPIVSKFNLNLKVNLDLNVANKEGGKQEAETNVSKQQEASKARPTAQQLKRRADLARIKELEKENKHLEKVFEKIVTAYTKMKANLDEKSTEYDRLREKHSQEETKLGKLVDELLALKKCISNLESVNKKQEIEKIQLSKDLRQEKEDKIQKIKHFESKLQQLENQSKSSIQKLKEETGRQLLEKQTTLEQKESELAQLSHQLQTLQEDFAKSEANHLRNSQQHLQRQAQLELKVMELMQKNRELTAASQQHQFSTSTTVREDFTSGSGHVCPLCGSTFKQLADLQIHIETCVS